MTVNHGALIHLLPAFSPAYKCRVHPPSCISPFPHLHPSASMQTNTNLSPSLFTKQKMTAVKHKSNGASAVVVSEYKTGSGTLSSNRFWCEPCKRIFRTWQQLHDHKEKMSAQGKPKHIHCQFCSLDFHTEAAKITHIQQVSFISSLLLCCPANLSAESPPGTKPLLHRMWKGPLRSSRWTRNSRRERVSHPQYQDY